ncbi:MAG TPA: extracellular solute-binding protein [Limnochordia bacterium]
MLRGRWIGVWVLALVLGGVWPAAAAPFVVGIAEWYIPEGVAFWERVMVPAFEREYPDLDVTLEHISWNAEKLRVTYAAGVAPDVVQYGSDKFGSFQPMLLPLDRFMEARPIEAVSDIPQAAFAATTKGGQLFGVPFSLDVRTLVYRPSLFAAAGLPDRGPDTWEELAAFAKKVTKRDAAGAITQEGIHVESHWYSFGPWLFQAGGRYVGEDGHSAFSSTGTRTAVQFAQELFQVHGVTAREPLNFESGRVAMAYESAGVLVEGEIGFDPQDIAVPLPPMRARRTTLVSPNSWGIVKISQHPEAAWDWIRLATEREHLAEMARLNGLVPPRLSLANVSPWNDPRLRGFFEAAGMGTTFNGGAPGFEYIVQRIVSPTLGRIIYEGAPLTELEQASRQIESVLREEAAKAG